MQISSSDFLALLALLISAAAAYYSKRAVDMARLGNRISLHEPRARIFESIFNFRRLFVDMDLHPTVDDIQDFYFKAVLPSHIYLPSEFTTRLHQIYADSHKLFEKIEQCESGQLSESKWIYINKLQDIGHIELDQLIRDLTAEIDLGKA